MPVPAQPANLIPRPFASGDGATYQIIPDAPATHGRASFKQGFPTETQLPLREGGVAPNRMDFQGLFNLLTAFGFWQQSGGLWTYSPQLNYAKPAIVFLNDALWWCNEENGPDTGAGAKEPGADGSESYWYLFLKAPAGGGGASAGGNPVGTVIMYYGTEAPDGYLICDGDSFDPATNPNLFDLLGEARTPDMRGLVVRGYDPTGQRDPDGANEDGTPKRSIGSVQDCALENIKGYYRDVNGGPLTASGALYIGNNVTAQHINASVRHGFTYSLNIDASRVARTSTETRGANMNLLFCIKHD